MERHYDGYIVQAGSAHGRRGRKLDSSGAGRSDMSGHAAGSHSWRETRNRGETRGTDQEATHCHARRAQISISI